MRRDRYHTFSQQLPENNGALTNYSRKQVWP